MQNEETKNKNNVSSQWLKRKIIIQMQYYVPKVTSNLFPWYGACMLIDKLCYFMEESMNEMMLINNGKYK